MPTYLKPFSNIGGFNDYGAGYNLLPQWYIEPTGARAGDDYVAAVDFTPGSPPTIKTFQLKLTANQHRGFHYRFMAVPNPLAVNNPTYDTDISWRLWNTFQSPDTAASATITGTAVVTSDFIAGTSILDFEWKEYNIQIAEGEATIDADLVGVFTQGSFTLDIIGTVVLIVEYDTRKAIRERWRWNTKVITSWNATEQRIQYAPYPVREITADYELDEQEIISLERLLYQSVNGNLSVPMWHLECFTTATTTPPQDRIYFPVENTNLRNGEQLYLVSPSRDESVIVTIETLQADGAVLTSSVPQVIGIGWSVHPLEPVYVNNPKIRIKSVTGNAQISGEATNRLRPVQRQGATATVPTHNGLPVLDFRALADVEEEFQQFYEEVGTSFGQRSRKGIWETPRLLRSATLRVDRKGDMTNGYEAAAVFFDLVAGQLKPFYFSSRLDDLTVNVAPNNGASQLVVNRTDYATLWFNSVVYKNVEVEYRDGSYDWFTVTAATANVDGTTTLNLSSNLPLDVESNPIVRVSYLLRVRLATDEVRLTHVNNRTTFSFSILGTTT